MNTIANTIKELKEKRAAKVEEMEAVINAPIKEERSITEDETAQHKAFAEELRKIDEELEVYNAQNEINARSAKVVETPNIVTKKENRKFDVAKALREYSTNGILTGVEKELSDETANKMGVLGNANRGIFIPFESRAFSATTTGEGEELVPTFKQGFIDALTAKTVVGELGATTISGLTGNIEIPKLSASTQDSYESSETGTASVSDASFGEVSLSPRRYSQSGLVSEQLLIQAPYDALGIMRDDILRRIALDFDKDVLDYIISVGTEAVAADAAGNLLDRSDILSMQAAVEGANVDISDAGFALKSALKYYFKDTKVDAGSGKFIIEGDELIGSKYSISNQFATTDKSGNDTSPIIYGAFKHVKVGLFGGLNITINPYTYANTGQVEVVANTYMGYAVDHPAAFSYVSDARHA